MKEGWKERSLMDICNVTTGKHDANHAETNGKYRFYTCSSQYQYCNTFRYSGECLILPGNGANVGEVFYYNGIFDAYQRTYVIDKIKEDIYPMFLFYHLKNNWKTVGVAKQYGSATNYIKIGNFQDYKVSYPSLAEQERIVEYLDRGFEKIDEVARNAEKSLEEAKAVFQGALKEMMEGKEGWREMKLKDCCIKTSNIKWIDHKGEKYKYIDLTAVDRNTLSITDTQLIDSENAPSRAKQIVKTGDVIFATTRPTLRRVTLITELYDNNICSTGFCVLRPKAEMIESKFLLYLFVCDSFYTYIEPLQTGANYPAVTDGMVKDYMVSYPSLMKQQQIVAKLDALSERVKGLERCCKETIEECRAMKQAMLREVFE